MSSSTLTLTVVAAALAGKASSAVRTSSGARRSARRGLDGIPFSSGELGVQSGGLGGREQAAHTPTHARRQAMAAGVCELSRELTPRPRALHAAGPCGAAIRFAGVRKSTYGAAASA